MKKIFKEVLCYLMIACLSISICGCSAKKIDTDEGEKISSKTYTESTTEDLKRKYPVSFEKYKKNDIISNEELIDSFNNNVAHFDKETQTLLRKNLDEMMKNGDKLSSVLRACGFPDANVAINENFVKPLKNIKFIYFYGSGDAERDKKAMESGTSFFSDEDQGIYVYFPFSQKETEIRKMLKEECIHGSQDNIVNHNLGYEDYLIFGEGKANLFSWVLTDGCVNNEGAYCSSDENLNEYENYGLSYGAYCFSTKYYVYLCALLGYKIMAEFEENISTEILMKSLSVNYNIDGEKFYNDMKSVIAFASENNWPDVFNEYLDIEKTFWKCMEHRLDRMNSKEDVEAFFELYRYLNLQFGFGYYEFVANHDDGSTEYANRTDKKLDLSVLDNKLFEKMEKFGILSDVNGNKEIRRKIFNSLVHVNIFDYIYETLFPILILDADIKYNADTNELSVYSETFSFMINTNNGKVKAL